MTMRNGKKSWRSNLSGVSRRIAEISLYVLSPLAVLVTSPLLAQGLGPVDRGELGVAQAIAAFAVACGALGQAEVYLALKRDGEGERSKASWLVWIGGIGASIVATLAALLMGLGPLTALVILVTVPLLAHQALWRADTVLAGRLAAPGIAIAVGSVARILLLSALAWLGLLSTHTALGAIQFSAIFGVCVGLGILVWKLRPARIDSGTWSLAKLTLAGSPLLLFNVFTAFTLQGDLLLLPALVSLESLGIYAAAAALSLAVLTVSGAFKTRVQAAFYSPSPRSRVNRELALTSIVGLAGAGVVFFATPWIVQMLLGPGYGDAVPVLRILAFGAAALMLLDAVHGALAVLGHRWRLVIVALVGAVVTLAFVLLLVPAWGISGAAAASLIAYSSAAATGWAFVGTALNRDAVPHPERASDSEGFEEAA